MIRLVVKFLRVPSKCCPLPGGLKRALNFYQDTNAAAYRIAEEPHASAPNQRQHYTTLTVMTQPLASSNWRAIRIGERISKENHNGR